MQSKPCFDRHRRESELNRLRQRVADLRYRYSQIDPENRFVAADCERQLEEALRELDAAERRASTEPPRKLNAERILAEAAELAPDVRRLFYAPTTTPRDRKRLLRALIHRVWVDPRSPERIPLRIEWVDGAPAVEVEAPLLGFCRRIAADLAAQGLGPTEIARRMNAQGLRTTRDTPWTRQSVRALLLGRTKLSRKPRKLESPPEPEGVAENGEPKL